MTGKNRFSRWLVGAALLAAVDIAGLAALELAISSSAQAQLFGDDRFPFLSRQRQQRPGGGGFFGGFFGGGQRQFDNTYEQQAPVDNSRAPPPKKAEAKPDAVAPTTSVVVMGDAMADWLAYGLKTPSRIHRRSPLSAKTNCTRDCCDMRRKAISIGGMLRATCSLKRSRISW
jgi:hypothetical protein